MIGTALLGQFLSLAITLSGTVNEYLFRRHHANFPVLQTVMFYLVLSAFYLPCWLLRSRKHGSMASTLAMALKLHGPVYLGYAMLDCFAALLVIKAYLFTSLAVVALLSTISTPCVILLSRIFLNSRFRPLQYTGAAICVAGVVFFSVAQGLDKGSGDAWLGGMLALGSALLYACANVLAERLVTGESYDSYEFLALTGTAGLLVSLVILLIFGRDEPGALFSQPASVYPLVFLHVLAIFGFYSAMPVFIRRASATFFNLSLLTVNIYSALVNLILFQDAFTWAFPIALVIVNLGIIVYSY